MARTRTIVLDNQEKALAGTAPTIQSRIGYEWSEIIEITPALAIEWLHNYVFDGQRKLKPRVVDFYAMEMQAGRFATSEIRLVHVGDATYLTNGQHRLHGVVKSGVPIRANIYHKISTNRKGAAEDYASADGHSQRTAAEQLAATDVVQRTGLSNMNFNALVSALSPIIGGFTSSSYSKNSMLILRSSAIRLRAVEDYAVVARKYFEDVSGVDGYFTRSLRRQPILSVALVTMLHCPDRAVGFWAPMAHNDGLRRGDPRHTLHKWINDNNANSSPVPYQSRIVAAAWNSFYKEDSNSLLKVVNPNKPIRILGTSEYNGKQIYYPYGVTGC